MDRVRDWAVKIILFHAAVSIFHGLAHVQLDVGLSAFQNIYVGTVITLVPLVVLWLLRHRTTLAGAWLLTLSMAGALGFGLYFHFVHESPDHVAHLPGGDPYLFQITAWLILFSETIGMLIGLWLLKNVYQHEAAYE